jgi:hypothetical protein
MPRTVKSHRAHAAVAYALKIGKLVKPDACEQCGRQDSKLEAAHHDYDKKLDVKWLCVGCHRSWDKQEPKGGTPATEERMQKLDGIQDRVIELKRVPAREIHGAPWNWRTHDTTQQDAVAASIEELGFYEPLLVYKRPDGSLMLIDGHLRRELITARVGPETLVPVIVTDLTEEEAKKANVVHDPLAAMAGTDDGKLTELFKEISADSARQAVCGNESGSD